MGKVETKTFDHLMKPIGPYAHLSRTKDFISISAIAGVDPKTQSLAGEDIASQTRAIVAAFKTMLEAEKSGLDDILHVNVFLTDMADFEAMNMAYEDAMEGFKPARTVIGVAALPKPGAKVTMNFTAVVRD